VSRPSPSRDRTYQLKCCRGEERRSGSGASNDPPYRTTYSSPSGHFVVTIRASSLTDGTAGFSVNGVAPGTTVGRLSHATAIQPYFAYFASSLIRLTVAEESAA
jgi:hypothetical protein